MESANRRFSRRFRATAGGRPAARWVRSIILEDDNGEEHVFSFETFFNTYQALTLGLHKSRRPTVIAV